jgi:hypothetical protein
MEVLTMEVSSFVPPTNKQTNKQKKTKFSLARKGISQMPIVAN